MPNSAVSVVMPVHNALPYLDAAVESILNQSMPDFQFVIHDDGSTDGSLQRLRYWASVDERIQLSAGKTKLGPAASSNLVVERSQFDLVARMDADDVAHPERLQRQREIMNARPEAVLLGSVWEGIDRTGKVVREPDLSSIFARRFSAPIAHGSIIFRRDVFQRVGGYRAECDFWEDLDLFVRMSREGTVLIGAEPLHQHRFSDTSTRLTSAQLRVEEAVDRMLCCRRAFEAGMDYDAILRRPCDTSRKTRLNPGVYVCLGFINLWAGYSPKVFTKLLKRGHLKLDFATIRALIWTAAADYSPVTIRRLMRARLRMRNMKIRKKLGAPVFEWHNRSENAQDFLPIVDVS